MHRECAMGGPVALTVMRLGACPPPENGAGAGARGFEPRRARAAALTICE
jgi:hypothetical protein